MTATVPGRSRKHPAKRFQIPADIRALGNYATVIINGMRNEYEARMRSAQGLRQKVAS